MPAVAPESHALALVADIGGTHARFALMAPGGREIVSPIVLPCADYPGLAEAAQTYLAKAAPQTRPRLGAFDVAGPVLGDMVELTNHPWRISISAVRRELGLDRLEVINDFSALAYAVPRLIAEDRKVISEGAADAAGPIAILGPGTGLGVGVLVPSAAGWVPVASEGGHATMAGETDREASVLAILRRRFGHVSAERVLSGPGLVNLYEALCTLADKRAEPLTPERVAERAQAGEAPAAEALSMFFAMMGGFAGSLALIVGARGGVTIAGGIVPRLLPQFVSSDFSRRFVEKGRFRSYLEAVPVQVITHPLPAFVGLAGLLADVTTAPAHRPAAPRRIARRHRRVS